MDCFEGRLSGLRKGSWTAEEDELLRQCMQKHGEGKWHQVPQLAGLKRCRKSCRLRWLNYLSPNIIRGKFSADEADYILRLHKLLGNRWSMIAGRLPGRTANDVKNYWNTHLQKKMTSPVKEPQHVVITNTTHVFRPKPRLLSKSVSEKPSFQLNCTAYNGGGGDDGNHRVNGIYRCQSSGAPLSKEDGETQWWEHLSDENDHLEVNLVSPSLSCWPEEDFVWSMWRNDNDCLEMSVALTKAREDSI